MKSGYEKKIRKTKVGVVVVVVAVVAASSRQRSKGIKKKEANEKTKFGFSILQTLRKNQGIKIKEENRVEL